MIVLDETSISVGGGMVYLHAVINPDSRRILLLRLETPATIKPKMAKVKA